MKNVLIITSRCYQNANANGLCALELKKALEQTGKNVFVLGYSNNKHYNVKDKEYHFYYERKKKEGRINSLKRLLVPRFDDNLINYYYEKSKIIIEKKKIDCIISVYFPIETEIVLTKIKKEYSHIIAIAYEVDSATDKYLKISRLENFYNKTYINYKKALYKNIDFIFVMNSHKNDFLHNYNLENKTVFSELPVFVKNSNSINVIHKDTIDFFYTGYLDKDARSPVPILNMFSNNIDMKNWRLHFYTSGNCEEIIKKCADKDNRIIQHGYVPNDILNEAIQKANFFISLENSYKPNSLPSKTFKYFSYGKPIIHFSNKNTYMSKNYVSKYPLAIIVENEKNENDKLLDFIEKNKYSHIDYDETLKYFYKNTPEYNAKLINDIASSLTVQ